MPRAPVAGREIRRRSRNGCWNCKARKVKCGEEKPRCSNCTRLDEDCDYKIRLSWGGRPLKKKLLEQGCHMDDPSQNIPGAGQFSINSFTPAPSAPSHSHSQRHSHGLSPTSPHHISPGGIRKTSAKTGSKGGMSVFQNVFSVCDATPPPSLMGSSAIPQYYATFSSQPFYPGVWTSEREAQPPLTPVTLDGEVYYTIKEDGVYLPCTPYGSHLASPTPSLTTLPMNSPTNVTASSSLPQSPMISLTDHSTFQHALGSMPPRIKSSASPELHHYNLSVTSAAMIPSLVVPSSTNPSSLASSIDYLGAPLTPPTLTVEHHHLHAYGSKGARRVSVENLLATPMSSYHGYQAFGDRFPPSIEEYSDGQESDHNSVMGHFQVTNLESPYEDDEVEEVQRYQMLNGGYESALYSPVSNGQGTLVAHPVYRAIPRALHPLPPLLLENTQNAMYFHHFLTHTASLLVPVDCGGNPFKSILPKMAMQDSSLLNLLLAYSASHQARLVKQPEPTELVSSFLGQTVSSLNQSLNDPVKQKSDSTLATAIMLCSYEIISPNSFARGINWQTHLAAVRKIVMARGGVEGMNSRDEVSYFLSRWFAYLDVLGSLSGKDNQYPLFNGKYWTNDEYSPLSDFSVDCFFGFTNRFISLLAQIGDLARKCDVQKREYVKQIQSLGYNSTASEWVADDQILHDAARLREQLEDSRRHAVGDCSHNHHHEIVDEINASVGRGPLSDADRRELLATNDAYHWAAQVHLLRRVFNYPTNHQHVQHAVHGIMDAIQKVREDGTAENCLLFPLFTAGCESIDGMDRDYTLRRMLRIENSGLTQIHLARVLMQNVWQTGSSWEVLSNGEFIG